MRDTQDSFITSFSSYTKNALKCKNVNIILHFLHIPPFIQQFKIYDVPFFTLEYVYVRDWHKTVRVSPANKSQHGCDIFGTPTVIRPACNLMLLIYSQIFLHSSWRNVSREIKSDRKRVSDDQRKYTLGVWSYLWFSLKSNVYCQNKNEHSFEICHWAWSS